MSKETKTAFLQRQLKEAQEEKDKVLQTLHDMQVMLGVTIHSKGDEVVVTEEHFKEFIRGKYTLSLAINPGTNDRIFRTSSALGVQAPKSKIILPGKK